MTRRANHPKLLGRLSLLGLLTLTNVGCAAFECTSALTRYAARLDERTNVQLSEYRQFNAILRGPKYNYAELTLAIGSRDGPILSAVVARRGAEDCRSASAFDLGKLEARTDPDRQRVWIIDRDADRVIATADRDTAVVTGLDDEPPAWAKADQGIVLEASPTR